MAGQPPYIYKFNLTKIYEVRRMSEWQKVESEGSEFWKPDVVGESIEGVLEGIEVGTYGKEYTIKLLNGECVKTPSHKVLQNRMSDGKFEVGDEVKIVYDGELPPKVRGDNPTRLYTVLFKPSQRMASQPVQETMQSVQGSMQRRP
jgi:hypothetical protein